MSTDIRYRIGSLAFRGFGVAVLLFLTLPILAIIPLSFTSGVELVYPLKGYSLRWYEDFFQRPEWLLSFRNSIFVGLCVTSLATAIGTACAFGMARVRPGVQAAISAFVVLPMAIPIVIAAVAFYFFYAALGLAGTFTGLILAQTTMAIPFVVISVRAAQAGLDPDFGRAAANLGASPWRVFRRVTGPIIFPGILTGALFAFAVSFDDVVIAMFLSGPGQVTLPKQMFTGVRENISPTILAASSLMVLFSILLMVATGYLSGRARRMRGAPVAAA